MGINDAEVSRRCQISPVIGLHLCLASFRCHSFSIRLSALVVHGVPYTGSHSLPARICCTLNCLASEAERIPQSARVLRTARL